MIQSNVLTQKCPQLDGNFKIFPWQDTKVNNKTQKRMNG